MAIFHPFLWVISIPLCVYEREREREKIYHIFFIYSFVDEHLGFSHVLAIVNSATMNIGVHVSFLIRVLSFLYIYSVMRLLDHMVTLFL